MNPCCVRWTDGDPRTDEPFASPPKAQKVETNLPSPTERFLRWKQICLQTWRLHSSDGVGGCGERKRSVCSSEEVSIAV